VHCPATVLRASQQCDGLGIEQPALDLTVSGMIDACSTGGTGYPLFARNEKYVGADVGPYEAVLLGAVACKTGTAEFGGNNASGYEQTHAWFTSFVGTKQLVVDATPSARVIDGDEFLDKNTEQLRVWHDAWKKQVQAHGLPETLAITVLVESDEVEPFREGSADAAPIAAKLLEWMETGEVK